MKHWKQLTVALLSLGLTFAACADNSYEFHTVVKSGDAPPGYGGTFVNLLIPKINANGQVAFVGTRNVDIGAYGLWIADLNNPGVFEPIALSHTQAPGTAPGTVYGSTFGFFELNDAGNVGFNNYLLGLPGEDLGLFRSLNGVVEKVAAPGDAAPGIGGDVVFEKLPLAFGFNEGSLVSFAAHLKGGNVNAFNNTAVYMHWFGGLNLVKRKGSTAPPIQNGWTWGTDYLSLVQIANDGRVTFPSELNTPQGEKATRWSGWPGALTLGTMGGDIVAPGFPLVNSQFPGSPHNTLTHDGFSFPHSIDVQGTTYAGFWLHNSNTNTNALIALVGGAGPLGMYAQFGNWPTQSSTAADGSMVFRARFANLNEASDTAIVLKRHNQPATVVIQEGQQAPGFWNGVTIDELMYPIKTIVDEASRVYFEAYLAGTGIDATNNMGLWAVEPDGQSRLVIRRGQLVTLDDGVARVVESFNLAQGRGQFTGQRHGVNVHGQIALRVNFTDATSAIVIAKRPTCPADLNNDGFVDVSDLLILFGSWGSCVGCPADIAKNGVVDVSDLLMLLSAWGACQ